VPTVVPPLVHVVGAEACEKTVKVIVPVALLPLAADSTELIDDVAIAAPALPVAGAAAVTAAFALLTTVSAMPEPHVEADALLLVSPP